MLRRNVCTHTTFRCQPRHLAVACARPPSCGWKAAGRLRSSVARDSQEGTQGNQPTTEASVEQDLQQASYVAAPLLRKGTGLATYVALSLRFPNAATSNQRRRGQRGVSLDFILDTGSTVNVLNPAVARELALPVVGTQAAGTGAAGGLAASPIFLLGDSQLDYLPPDQRFTFMTGLQAAGLAVPSPSCSGILGRAFIDCFAAVELLFETDASDSSNEASTGTGEQSSGGSQAQDTGSSDTSVATVGAADASSAAAAAADGSTLGASASGAGAGAGDGSGCEIRFHTEFDIEAAVAQQGLVVVPLSPMGQTSLWGAQLRVQGPAGMPEVIMPALVDTGAPVTILNPAAAAALGLRQAAPEPPAPPPEAASGKGLFGGIGKLLGGMVGRNTPQPVPPGALVGGHAIAASEVPLEVSLGCKGEGDQQGWVPLGTRNLCIGDLPGMQALGISKDQPGVILGLDALSYLPGIVLCPQQQVMLV